MITFYFEISEAAETKCYQNFDKTLKIVYIFISFKTWRYNNYEKAEVHNTQYSHIEFNSYQCFMRKWLYSWQLGTSCKTLF